MISRYISAYAGLSRPFLGERYRSFCFGHTWHMSGIFTTPNGFNRPTFSRWLLRAWSGFFIAMRRSR